MIKYSDMDFLKDSKWKDYLDFPGRLLLDSVESIAEIMIMAVRHSVVTLNGAIEKHVWGGHIVR